MLKISIVRTSHWRNAWAALVALGALTGFGRPAFALDYYVDPAASDTAGCGSETSPCQTISYLLGIMPAPVAGQHDVYLAAGTHLVRGEFITFDVAFHGEGMEDTLLDAENLDRHFEIVPGVTASFDSLTLEHGSNTFDDGGSIYMLGSVLELTSVRMRRNEAARSGGAIAIEGGTLIVHDARFNRNVAEYGGAIACLDDTIMGGDSCEAVEIHDSRFLMNAASRNGGAVYALTGAVEVRDSALLENSAGTYGGAMYVDAQGVLDLFHSQLTGNTAGHSGGAVYADVPLTVRRSSFVENAAELMSGAVHAVDGLLANSTFASNTAGHAAGAISGTNLDVAFCTFFDNEAVNFATDIYGMIDLSNSLIAHTVPPAAGGPPVCTGVITAATNIVDASTCGFAMASPDLTSMAALSGYTFGGEPSYIEITAQTNPAVDSAGTCLAGTHTLQVDQRGQPRPAGAGNCDVGAFEYQ